MSEPNRQCGKQPDANPELQHSQPKFTTAQWWSDISERARIEIVGDCVGVWSFGGVQMCFALLPNEAKVKAYDAFIALYCARAEGVQS